MNSTFSNLSLSHASIGTTQVRRKLLSSAELTVPASPASSLKRAIREYAQDNLPEVRFGGQRTKLIVKPLAEALRKTWCIR